MNTSKKLFVVVLFAIMAVALSACGRKGDCYKGGTWESAGGNPNYKYGICKLDTGEIYAAGRGITQEVDASDYSKPLGPNVKDPSADGIDHAIDGAKRAGNPVDNAQRGVDTANSCHWENITGTDGNTYNKLVCTAQ